MLELIETHPVLDVQESEYSRLLGFPRVHEITERTRELADWARAWYADRGRPWWYARRADRVALAGGRVVVDGTSFTSARLHEQMVAAEADSAVVVAVSAGSECEEHARQLWEEGKPDEYYFLEIFGSAVVESLVSAAAYRLCAWADETGLAVLPHYSPGYPEWDIADQDRLLRLIAREGHPPFPGDLRVMDTGMLVPKKSLLAVFGLTPRTEKVQRLTSLVPCTNCSLRGCRYRRAPYGRPLPRTDSVGLPDTPPAAQPPLTEGARYSTGTSALQRWAQQRLRLRVGADGTVDARFKYEGTTCSNMGHPLAFEYRVRLTSREEGYRIVAATCAPAPDDTGHELMCEYLDRGPALMDAIATERPLVGRPLDDVLTWQRGRDSSGCYCTAEAREHKWGLALEVLHYALLQGGGHDTTPGRTAP